MKYRLLYFLSFILLFFFACKKDKDKVSQPKQPDQNELITTLRLLVTDSANPVVVSETVFSDPDGPGGDPPVRFDTLRLKPYTVYFGKIYLLDETKVPADTISQEVWEKRNEHEFFFYPSSASIVTSYKDFDDYGVPVGLETKIETGAATTGQSGVFEIVLRHQPDEKPRSGAGDANIGTTDLDVAFPVIID
jgi:hypothetical protein